MHLLAGLSLSTPTSPGDRSGAGTPSLFGPPSGRNSPRFASAIERKRSVRTERRREGYVRTLNQDRGAVDLAELKRLAWNGVPEEVRPIVWQLLLVGLYVRAILTR
jgi:hypothetical protein